MLTRQSHKIIDAKCEFNISEKCIISRKIEYRSCCDNKDRNNGKYICLHCSRKLKASGRNNPNVKYSIDDNIFSVIDNEYKAYILGFIASDGHLSNNKISICINNRDIDILIKIRDYICKDVPIKLKNDIVSLNICSSKIMTDICNILQIVPGKKSDKLSNPLIDEKYYLSYIRGYFDGDGSITNPAKTNHSLISTITSNSKKLLDWIKNIIDIPCYNGKNRLEYSCNNALDFLGRIYTNSNIHLDRKYELYNIWCSYIPGISGYKTCKYNEIKFIKTRKEAVLPSKNRISDSGYDLTIIEKIKTVGDVEFYTTGIKTQLDFGWFSIVCPRSSISKTGYMLANSIGIIDRTYLGEIIIALIKVDKNAKDLSLPIRIAQLIPMPIVHFNVIEVNEFEDTNRGEGGFGSSGR